MSPIIIGAGRGSRLKTFTTNQPKCYALIGEVRILNWILKAFADAKLETPVFIGGYCMNQIRKDYPHLNFCHNTNWKDNGILASLMCAKSYMAEGFICSYSDILFHGSIVEDAVKHSGEIVICVDTHWRDRYVNRSQHPEIEAEKVIAKDGQVMSIYQKLEKNNSEKVTGEYIGVAKFTPKGTKLFLEYYHRIHKKFAGKIWRENKLFEKANIIFLLQEMVEQGELIHIVTTKGKYIEIDTDEDYHLANKLWIKEFQ